MCIVLAEFSMSCISIPKVKKVIRNSSYTEVKAMAEKALALPTAKEIETLVEGFIAEKA